MGNAHKEVTMSSVTSALSTTPAAAAYCGDIVSAAVCVFGTFTGTIQVEQSPDNSNWYDAGATLTAAGYRSLNDNARYVRLNADAWTSGTGEAKLVGKQKSLYPARDEVVDIGSVTGSGSSSDAVTVQHLEDAALWISMPSACTVRPEYSADGSAWIAVSTVGSTVSNGGGEAFYTLPTNVLQARCTFTAMVSTGSAQVQLSGRDVRAGKWRSVALGTVIASTSTSPFDITDMENPEFYATYATGASATVVCYGSPDGTNFYEVTSQLTSSFSRALPSWVKQVKGVALGMDVLSTITFTVVENGGLRTDKGY